MFITSKINQENTMSDEYIRVDKLNLKPKDKKT